jgi:hypothetical protein
MKKLTNIIIGLSIVLGLTACGTSWVNLNNKEVNDTTIQTAKDKCDYHNKIMALYREQDGIDYTISLVEMSDKVKKEWEELKKEKEVKFHKEMDKCMKKEGLKRQK